MKNEKVVERPEIGLSVGQIWIFLAAVSLAAIIIVFTVLRPVVNFGTFGVGSGDEGTFISDRDGFSVRYPLAWRPLNKQEKTRSNGHFAFAAKYHEPNAFFGVRAQPIVAKNVRLDQVAATLERELAKKFTGFQKINQRILTLEGSGRALQYDYLYTPSGEQQMRERLVIVIKGSKVFHLTAWSHADDYGRVSADIDGMIRNFSVGK